MDNYHYLKRQLLKKGPAEVVASCQVDSWKMIEFAVRLLPPVSRFLLMQELVEASIIPENKLVNTLK